MLKLHADIFSNVAREKKCHILVRCPNRASDRFIGNPQFTAKPLNCKAKTADNPQHQFAGLVVSPEAVPDAFLPNRRGKATTLWQKFSKPSMPPGFALASGQWNGCLTLQGKLIHADYDLLAAAPAEGSIDSATNPELRSEFSDEFGHLTPYVKMIMDLLNGQFKTNLVKHGAEFDADVYNYGLCDHFYPDGTHQVVTYTGNSTLH